MFATVDPVFRGRGWRNQYIPPITEENLRDNAYSNMKRGGKVVKKKGKTTASATATSVVNVYTGRRGRTAPSQPRPPKPPQPINVSVQLPNYQQSIEPFQNMRLQDLQRINDIQAQMLKMSEPLKALQLSGFYSQNVGRPPEPLPIKEEGNYEPYEPIEMKHEKEPDELIILEQDLQPEFNAPTEEAVRRRRRTKEEMEIAKLAKEEAKRVKEEAKRQQEEAKKRLIELKEEEDADRLYIQIRRVRMEIERRQKEDPNDPQITQLKRSLEKLTKK